MKKTNRGMTLAFSSISSHFDFHPLIEYSENIRKIITGNMKQITSVESLRAEFASEAIPDLSLRSRQIATGPYGTSR